jgi:hypothetical protein
MPKRTAAANISICGTVRLGHTENVAELHSGDTNLAIGSPIFSTVLDAFKTTQLSSCLAGGTEAGL